jgi:GDSL-like Lipase/Acylhydrolase family
VHRYSFPCPEIAVRGALDLHRTAHGIRPRRLPAWTRSQLPVPPLEPLMEFDVAATAGVRLAFDTASTWIELQAHFTRLELEWSGAVDAAIDLVIDGTLFSRQQIIGGDLVTLRTDGSSRATAGEGVTVRFEGLPAGGKTCELWLPQTTGTELVGMAAELPLTRAAAVVAVRWVHYGSSISHCLEAVGPTSTWPAVAASLAGVDCTNLGLAGNAVLDPYVARVIRDLPSDVVSLKLGVNVVGGAHMSPRAFLAAVHGYLDTIRDGHPTIPIVLLSPIHCPVLELNPAGIPLTIVGIRSDLRELVGARDDPALFYLDGRDLLGTAEAHLMPDGVHPNTEGYRLMGERFARLVFDDASPIFPACAHP